MSQLLPMVPALAVVGCIAVFVAGLRLVRSDAADGLEVGDLALLREEQRREATGRGPVESLGARLVPLLRRLMGPVLEQRLQRMVELAGRPDGANADTVLTRIGALLVLTVPAALLVALLGVWWAPLVLPLVAVLLPLGRIARERRLRQERITATLPDFLDVLAVTVTAGVGFRSALATVSERFGGPLGEEVLLTLHQIRNGASVRDAFQRLRARNDSEALSQFVSAFMQSEDLGAPLAQTLTRISEDTRRAAAQRQRQRAAKVAPRVTLVTSMVLVPGALALLFVGFVIGADIDFSAILGSFS